MTENQRQAGSEGVMPLPRTITLRIGVPDGIDTCRLDELLNAAIQPILAETIKWQEKDAADLITEYQTAIEKGAIQ